MLPKKMSVALSKHEVIDVDEMEEDNAGRGVSPNPIPNPNPNTTNGNSNASGPAQPYYRNLRKNSHTNTNGMTNQLNNSDEAMTNHSNTTSTTTNATTINNNSISINVNGRKSPQPPPPPPPRGKRRSRRLSILAASSSLPPSSFGIGTGYGVHEERKVENVVEVMDLDEHNENVNVNYDNTSNNNTNNNHSRRARYRNQTQTQTQTPTRQQHHQQQPQQQHQQEPDMPLPNSVSERNRDEDVVITGTGTDAGIGTGTGPGAISAATGTKTINSINTAVTSATATTTSSANTSGDASSLILPSSPLPPLPPSSSPPPPIPQRLTVKEEEVHIHETRSPGNRGQGAGAGEDDVEMKEVHVLEPKPLAKMGIDRMLLDEPRKESVGRGGGEASAIPAKPTGTSSTTKMTPLSEVLRPKSESSTPTTITAEASTEATTTAAAATTAAKSEDSLSSPTSTKPVSSASTKKPQSSKPKQVKRRSPSLEPAPRPPPKLQTVRLQISLGGPDNYSVDIAQLAKETGQRPPTPPPVKRDTSSSEDEGDDEGDEGEPSVSRKHNKPVKRKRRVHQADCYDLNDEFIDDSELAIDERMYIAQTKQSGFYVSAGDVALLKDKSGEKSERGKGGSGGSGGGLSVHDPSVPGSPARKPKSKKIVPTIIPLGVTSSSMIKPSISVSAAVAKNGADSHKSTPESASAPPQRGSGLHVQIQPPSRGNGTRETPIAVSDTEDVMEVGAGAGKSKNEDNLSVPDMWDTSMSIPPTASTHAQSPTSISTVTNGMKRKPSSTVDGSSSHDNGGTSSSSRKKRRTVGIENFKPELQEALNELKNAIKKESFEQKEKFPPGLKPILTNVALLAIRCGEYNEMFFDLMPKMFVYNRYTMRKLIKRLVHTGHQKLLAERQDDLLVELKRLADDGFERAKEEYEKNVQAWGTFIFFFLSNSCYLSTHTHSSPAFRISVERRQEKAKAGIPGGGGATSVEGTPAPQGSETPTANETATLHPPPRMENISLSSMSGDGVLMDVDIEPGTGGSSAPPQSGQQVYMMTDLERENAVAESGGQLPLSQPVGSAGAVAPPLHSSAHMPTRRFRLTDEMKDIIWELVAYSNESVRLENEKKWVLWILPFFVYHLVCLDKMLTEFRSSLEGANIQVSEQGSRKALYQKIVAAFPEGWMSSGQISREGILHFSCQRGFES